MQLTKDQQILRGLWAKAVGEGRLDLPVMPWSQAIRTRFLLFREAKAMRAEGLQGLVDTVLLEAMTDLTVRLKEQPLEGQLQVVIEPRVSTELAALAGTLGIEYSRGVGQEKAVEESLRRLSSLVERVSSEDYPASISDQSERADNPFYDRGR